MKVSEVRDCANILIGGGMATEFSINQIQGTLYLEKLISSGFDSAVLNNSGFPNAFYFSVDNILEGLSQDDLNGDSLKHLIRYKDLQTVGLPFYFIGLGLTFIPNKYIKLLGYSMMLGELANKCFLKGKDLMVESCGNLIPGIKTSAGCVYPFYIALLIAEFLFFGFSIIYNIFLEPRLKEKYEFLNKVFKKLDSI